MVNIKKSLKKSSQPSCKRLKAEVQTKTSDDPLLLQLNCFLNKQLLNRDVLNNHLLNDHLKPHATLLLALSGGLDSSVLLHLLVASRQTIPFSLYAMHVHHGLSVHADAWAEFCAAQCTLLNVPLEVAYVNIENNTKLGIEATARKLRYEALFSYKVDKTPPDFIVTAHHQDDQAETLLLQLFRGAGVKGLASMAVMDESRHLLRPLLGVSRDSLQNYAEHHGIKWCDDESNENTDFERNFVRHEVLPVLTARYPAIKPVLARVASHLAEANDLLDTLAKIDAESLLKDNCLCLQGLSALNKQRAKNVLRWWFLQNQLAMPSSEHLNEIVEQLLNAKPDANLSVQLQHLTLKRYQQKAYLIQAQITQTFDLVWVGESVLPLPNGGQLIFTRVTGAGLAVKFGMDKLRISNRDGGERFKPNALRPTRTLKHLLQEANIPPWQRDNIPLIYWHATLAFVPGIGISYELQATEHEQGLVITWAI